MSYTVLHGPCPYCDSSDAYSEYLDGGHHCFACGAHSSGNAYKGLGKLKVTKVARECMPLPEDAVPLLQAPMFVDTSKAFSWVKKYGITDAEIEENHFMWSETGTKVMGEVVPSLLIFPVFDAQGTLLMWQARSFDLLGKHPKYVTRGDKESVLHILNPDKSDTVVLTEDLLSALKVSRQAPAMPLWGSSLSQANAKRLASQYEFAKLWLDYDKRQYAMRTVVGNCLILPTTPIISILDPKEYTDTEIRGYLEREME